MISAIQFHLVIAFLHFVTTRFLVSIAFPVSIISEQLTKSILIIFTLVEKVYSMIQAILAMMQG